MNNKIACACGCGELIEEYDKYGRKRCYISGHNGRKYLDKTEYKKVWYNKTKDDPVYKRKKYENNSDRCRKLKSILVEQKGGVCEKCGLIYDGTNACVFDLHHINPDEKDFNVNVGTFNNRSIESVIEESKKCLLLCSNCHRLEHKIADY